MSHLQKISWILGTVLIGASAVLLYQKEEETERSRSRGGQPEHQPVEEMAEHLKEAWAGYHTP